jgi:beta-glucanase (GH16 family)
MRASLGIFAALLLLCGLASGCGGGGGSSSGSSSSGSGAGGSTTTSTASAPTITTAQAQSGAVIVTLGDSTSGATIYYTLDGTTPSTTSQQYQAPFLVASTLTVKALAVVSGSNNSSVTSQDFTPNIPSGTLVWSDEFANSGISTVLPDGKTWTYDTGYRCCGNNELETYCAAGSTTSPCDSSNPNAYIDTTGILHIVGRNPTGSTYTSARMKTQGLFSFMYGRIEARMKLPESQGMWPAFWLLGNNIATLNWPACGELDVMEHIDGSNPPPSQGGTAPGYDWIAGSVHGGTASSEANGSVQYHATNFSAADWHTYGMIWSKQQVQFYVDSPSNVYATFTPSNFPGTWPFDQGPQFIILNLAIGGDWPGSPDSTTVFPGDTQVDYVRIYTN